MTTVTVRSQSQSLQGHDHLLSPSPPEAGALQVLQRDGKGRYPVGCKNCRAQRQKRRPYLSTCVQGPWSKGVGSTGSLFSWRYYFLCPFISRSSVSLTLGITARQSPLQSLGCQLKTRPSLPLAADMEPAMKEPALGLEKSQSYTGSFLSQILWLLF